MEYELLEKLSSIQDFNEELLSILTSIHKEVHTPEWDPYIAKLSLLLVSFTCQNKYSHLRKVKCPMISINKIMKKVYEYCLDVIFQIFLKLTKFKEKSLECLTEYFLDHFDTHPLCLGSLEIFYKTVFYSSKLQLHLKKECQLPCFIDFFEKIVLKMLKNFENPERFAVLNESLTGGQNSDFQVNMKKLLMNLNSPSQTPKNLIESFQNLNLFSPNSGYDPIKQMNANMELENLVSNPLINNSERDFQQIRSPVKMPSHPENIMSTSINLGNKNNNESNPSNLQKKNFKIPLLQIPTNITENYPVVSRSTRRADPYKSFSTTSNRFSNSIDLAGKNLEGTMGKTGYINKNLAQENNISIMDNENSLFYEDNTPALAAGMALNSGKTNELSSTEKMRVLANQLGEYCLTVDLGCLLLQKRKRQLDQVAKIEEVDSIMDIKIDKKTIKDKLFKKGLKKSDNDHEIEKPNFLDSMEIKDMNASQEISMTSLKSQENIFSMQNKKKKIKRELKIHAKICKILSNIIYMILREYNSEELNFIISPINIIYMYLCSCISSRIRRKEMIKLAFSKNGWSSFNEIEFEYKKSNIICDGFENQQNINKHYQKTILEQYKFVKQKQEAQNNKSAFVENPKFNNQEGSTFLYFSTTNDHSSSKSLSKINDSLDSMALNEKNIFLDNIMLPESLICFKIIDIFSVQSEKTHEYLSCNWGIFENDPTKSKDDETERIFIRGVPINNYDEDSLRDVKKNSNCFLSKFKKKFTWFLNNLDMNLPIFYEIEKEQLEILERYLSNSTSRILPYEFLDYLLDILFMIKRQFIELSLPNLNTPMSTTRINTPHTKNLINNNIRPFKTSNFMSDSPMEKGRQNQENNSNIENNNFTFQQPQPSATSTNINIHFPLVLKYKDFFGIYLQIISRIILKAKKIDIYNLMNKLFVSNELFNELVRLYTTNIFNDLFQIIFDESKSPEIPKENNKDNQDESSYYLNNKISKKNAHSFINCQRVLFYYKVVCIMCKNIIEKEKLQKANKEKNEQKKEWKTIIRKILCNMVYLVRPSNGLLVKYLNMSTDINSSLISHNEEESPDFIIKYNLLKEIYQFICMIFSFDDGFSCFLGDDISSFYIRYSYINFVKLYSYSSNHELNEINLKLNEIKTKMNISKEKETNLKKNLEDIMNKKNSAHENSKDKMNNQKKFKNALMKLYVKCLFSLSNNRTEDIKRKFYQYRVVEFLTREIDLEYEITQIRERFLRIRHETKKHPNNEKNDEFSKNTNLSSLQLETKLPGKSNSQNTNPSTKSKVPLLNLSVGFKGGVNSQENNLPQKNINISEIQNESGSGLDKNESGSFNRTVLVKNIDYNPEEKSKYSIKMPETKTKTQQNISFTKKPAVLEEMSQISKTEMVSPNFSKKIAGKVFMPKLNLKGDKLETSKIGETPFDLKAMIFNAEKKQIRNEKSEMLFEDNDNFGKGGQNQGVFQVFDEGKKNSKSMIMDKSPKNSVMLGEPVNQKKKVTPPPIKIPNYKPNISETQMSDTKYAGTKSNSIDSKDKPPIKKPLKVPSLKIEEMKYDAYPEESKAVVKEHEEREGSLTKLENALNKSNPKMQLILEGSKIRQIPNFPMKSPGNIATSNLEEFLTENTFYYSERRLRKIYDDDELHVLVLSLVISLLLTPNRGVLDDLYCSQYPINNGKPNILYLLHFHLNHPSNQHVLPMLLSKMSEISPYPAGQRLLKLLVIVFSNMENYTESKKIATGAYGTVYQCNTNLASPQTVALKQLSFPKSIYDRCVLHDIFTEITCLEYFRLEPCVTDMYDYGVTETDYVIVMKKYPTSLKDWRMQQNRPWQENLPLYLTIYRDVLKSIQFLHNNNVTHYDIKADNILLDSKISSASEASNFDNDLRVTLADFGECKMFARNDDEYCLRNRGTEYIKSPEMLTLTINSKKEGDKYDRRKKIGTNRSSDIWSLGCLLYELLTGEFLFYHNDWVHFYIRVTSPNEVLLTNDKLEAISNNIYIIDFLKYILVRDPQHRPNIDSVLKRFEHIHGILVSNNPMSNRIFNTQKATNNFQISLENSLESYHEVLNNQNLKMDDGNFNSSTKQCPKFLKIVEEISLCSKKYFYENHERLISSGFTHIVAYKDRVESYYLKRFKILLVDIRPNEKEKILIFPLITKIIDYLKSVLLYRGKVLFIEGNSVSQKSRHEKQFMRNTLLFCLTYFFKTSCFETLNLINSQILYFLVPFSSLALISKCMSIHSSIEQYINTFPKMQCICGSCTLILKRQYNIEKNINLKNCSCSRESNSLEISDCPSDGCQQYLSFIKKRYKIIWEIMKWGYFDENDFIIGPFYHPESLKPNPNERIILNSEGIMENAIIYTKKTHIGSTLYSKINSKCEEWVIYKCKTCHMWMHAINKQDQKICLVLNNTIKRISKGIMNLDQKRMNIPVLRNFNLSELR